MPDENELQGGDSDAQAILDSLDTATPNGEPAVEPVEGAQAPAHSATEETAPKLIEIAGQKFKTPEDAYRWAERIFNRHSQESRQYAADKKRYERAMGFQERIEKDPAYLQHLLKAEDEYNRTKAAGGTNAEAAKAAKLSLDQLPPEVKEAVEKVRRGEEKADAEATLNERKEFEKAHPGVPPAKLEKVVERLLHYAEKYGIEMSFEDGFAEIEVEELRAKAKSATTQVNRMKADNDVGPGQGVPHKPRPRDLTKEGSDDEFAEDLLNKLQAGGHVSS